MKRLLVYVLAFALVLSNISFACAKTSNESLDELKFFKSESSSKEYQITPEFDAEVLEYAVFIPDGRDECWITATPDDKDYTVKVNGTTVKKSNDYGYLMEDISGGDDIDIVVYDEDDKKLDTYSVTFYCGDTDDSDRAELDELYVESRTNSNTWEKISMNTEFDPDENAYSADVPENIYNSVRFYIEPDDSDAYMFVNGEAVKEGHQTFGLNTTGKYKYVITVVAENCEDIEEYVLTLNYGAGTSLSSDSTLNTVMIRDASGNTIYFSPGFSSAQLNYLTNIKNDISTVSFYVKATQDTSVVTLNGAAQANGGWSDYKPLNEGANTFKIVSTAANGSKTTYSVCIYRQAKYLENMVSIQKLTVNGTTKTMSAYNINGNNFVKLRDIASLLAGTPKQFAIAYNEATNNVILTYGGAYASNGQENLPLGAPKETMVSEQKVYVGTTPVNVMAYNIDGNNFVMLRDIALLFDFSVVYNLGTDTIAITTGSKYTP
ncbi:MAG: cadherin-like beta sandwich domain-containing protein [Clostridia bacterium]|nr:cadherin-like beta sandwich domain-containing protein [Clostridia bacterium]